MVRSDGSALGCEEVELAGEAGSAPLCLGRQGGGQHRQGHMRSSIQDRTDDLALLATMEGVHAPERVVGDLLAAQLGQAPTGLNHQGFWLGRNCDSMRGFPRRRADGGCLVR